MSPRPPPTNAFTAPPGRLRPTANAYPQSLQGQHPLAAQPTNPGLIEEIKNAMRRLLDYLINLIRAIFGQAPRVKGEQEQATDKLAAAKLAAKQGEEGVFDGEQMATGEKKFQAGAPPSPVQSLVAKDQAFHSAANDSTLPANTSAQMPPDDIEQLFAAMTGSMMRCMQAYRQNEPPIEGEDALTHLQNMSRRLNGAFAGLRTQNSLLLDKVMQEADKEYSSGSGQEMELAQRWMASGAVTPEQARALRCIASTQMLDTVMQIVRLGTRDQVLNADGVSDVSSAAEIQKMLDDSALSLAQAAVFARAGGEDPAVLNQEIWEGLDLQLEHDRQHERLHNQSSQGYQGYQSKPSARGNEGNEGDEGDDEDWGAQPRPA